MPEAGLSETINKIPDNNLKRATLSWLYKSGPFWEDTREHSSNDWFECNDEIIVTDSAVGEAASQILHGSDCGFIIVSPSRWMYSPIPVTFRVTEPKHSQLVCVKNWWVPQELKLDLEKSRPPHNSWHELAKFCKLRFDSLNFFKESFDMLYKLPFSKTVSKNIEKLLTVLNSLVNAYDSEGNRTNEGHQIINDFFTGAKPKFSDSSDSEKRKYRRELSFSDRCLSIYELSCPWHGKINNTIPIRIHFSWPHRSKEKLYVAYIGPKLTM